MAAAAPNGPELSRTRQILGVIETLAQLEDAESFGLSVLKAIAPVLPFDIGSFNEVDPKTERAVFCALPQDVGVMGEQVEEFPRLVQQNPILQYQHQTGDGSARRLSDFVDATGLHELELYRRIYQPLGIEYQVAVGLVVKSPLVVALALNRRFSDFLDSELALLDALRPHLSQSYRNLQTIQALRGIDGALAELGGGVVVLDDAGLNTRWSPWAQDVLQHHFGFGADGRLPEPVARWIEEERRHLFADGQPRIHRPLVSVLGDRQLVLRFIPGAGLRPDVVTLDERRPERVVAELARLSLTDREAEIMQQLLRGESVRGTATNVGVAPATLNKHLEHIYRKLGVTSRSAAVAAATDALFGIR